jgi:hypothetical protein
MVEFIETYPVIAGLLLSIALGLPVGLSIVWEMRAQDNGTAYEEVKWDSDWDLKDDDE